MRRRVYLAGPFFNEKQILLRDRILDLLRSHDFDVFSPGHDNLITESSTQDDIKNGFKKNLEEIDKCDLMVAIGNDYDTGTFIEIGYALKSKVPIIYYNDSNDGKRRNLMVGGACLFYATMIDELNMILSILDNKNEVLE